MDVPKGQKNIGTVRPADDSLRTLITSVIKRSPKKRPQIAQEMSLHAGRAISKGMIDDWTANSKKRARFPAALIESFCEVTGDDRLIRLLMNHELREKVELAESLLQLGPEIESFHAQFVRLKRIASVRRRRK